MVTQGKLEISTSENIEGKGLFILQQRWQGKKMTDAEYYVKRSNVLTLQGAL